VGRNCYQRTFTTINVVLMTPHIPRPAQRRGRRHHGGWTQIFGRYASEVDIPRPVEKRNIHLPHLRLGPPLGVIHRNFVGIFCVVQLESLSYRWRLRDPTFSRFGTTPTCDGPTVGQTDTR